MVKKKDCYPSLEEFFGTYFHQDWPEDAPSAREVVERYLAEWPLEEIRGATLELRRLLAEAQTEAKLEEAIKNMGNFYNPGAEALSYRDWLHAVLERFTLTCAGPNS